MASLQQKGDSWYCQFLYRGKRRTFAVGKVSREEAEAKAGQVDYLLLRLRQGYEQLPPGVGIVEFLRGDAKVTEEEAAAPEPLSLGRLRDRYLAVHEASLEETTLDGIRLHFRHLASSLGERFPLRSLTSADLQGYVDGRSKASGTRGRRLSPATIRKEIVTLRTAWNWGVSTDLLSGKFPTKGLRYPKTDEKPTFQTREEIERRIASGGVSEAGRAELWESLYLTGVEIEELLGFVEAKASHAWIYPMFCVAAHTGARRSEILRMARHDIDLEGQTVLIHEKKRARGRRTSRRVPLSPFLVRVLQGWIAAHPGGQDLFCQSAAVFRSKTRRTAPTPITRDEAHDHFKRTLSGSKWAVLRGWHLLRHSFVSLCASRGVDQRLIDEWVGHTTEEMRRRYRHLYPSVQREAICSIFPERQKTLVAEPGQLLVRDDPFLELAPSAGTLRGADAAEPAPLAHGELGLADDLRDFGRRVEVLHDPLAHQEVAEFANPLVDPVEPRGDIDGGW